MPLSIEQIRAANLSLPREPVDLPDLGGSVFVRALTLREVREIQNLQSAPNSKPIEITRRIVEMATCNEDGSALFVGEDSKLVDGLPWGAVDAISDAAMTLSGMKRGAADEEKKG